MNPQIKQAKLREEIKDWIETCLDADAHGSWVRAPKFEIIEDVAELMSPRIAKKLSQAKLETLEAIIKEVEGKEREGGELTPYLEVVRTGNMDKMFDYAYEKARKDFLTTLQAELEIIKKEQ